MTAHFETKFPSSQKQRKSLFLGKYFGNKLKLPFGYLYFDRPLRKKLLTELTKFRTGNKLTKNIKLRKTKEIHKSYLGL